MELATYEHPQDVIACWLRWREAGPVALALLTGTLGGSVRAPGAIMAISGDGQSVGYLSGGCIDADIIMQAQAALQTGEARQLRYGKDSPFADLQLPCNGALDVCIIPHADKTILAQAEMLLAQRKPVRLSLDESGRLFLGNDDAEGGHGFLWSPKMRLRIAGRGADCLTLARLAQASGFPVELWVRDGPDYDTAGQLCLDQLHMLASPTQLPGAGDDQWTAFALMFHEREWEVPLLQQALDGPAFYLGALGSPATHAKRTQQLLRAGVAQADIDRVHAPIGLVPRLRNASMLAVSVLAGIVDVWRQRND